MKLTDKVVLVTGGASGIGKSCCLTFAEQGATLAIADINKSGAEEVAAQIKKANGEAIAIQSDVSKESQIKQMIESIYSEYGRLDGIVSNAGIPCTAAIKDITEEKWQRTFDVNTKAFFFICKYAYPIMKKQGCGSIVVVSSAACIRLRPLFSVYSASKAAATNLSKSLALELAPYNIRVNSLNPVSCDTPMLKDFMKPGLSDEEGRKAFIDGIPLNRICTPVDVASAASFLISDEAIFITGVEIPIDGGRTI